MPTLQPKTKPRFGLRSKNPETPQPATQPEATSPLTPVERHASPVSGTLTFLDSKVGDVILLIGMVALTAAKFVSDHKMMALNLFFIVILLSGYAVGKRFGLIMSFLTLSLVWGYYMIDPEPFLQYYSPDTLYYNLAAWSGFLIVAGWLGQVVAENIHSKPSTPNMYFQHHLE